MEDTPVHVAAATALLMFGFVPTAAAHAASVTLHMP